MAYAKWTTDDPKQAALWLLQGHVLAYPTESVWGIGCDAFCKQAVLAVLALKNRPIDKGMIVLTYNHTEIMDMLHVLPMARQQQIIASWQNAQLYQQATTWLLDVAHVDIPHWLMGQHKTLAVRVTAHSAIRQLCQYVQNPQNQYGFIVSTSCNPSQKPPAMDFAQAFLYFGSRVRYFLGDTLHFDKPSAIYDACTGERIRD